MYIKLLWELLQVAVPGSVRSPSFHNEERVQ
jgi:hypothetical protein